jgi:hypothetical protein
MTLPKFLAILSIFLYHNVLLCCYFTMAGGNYAVVLGFDLTG